MSSFYDSYFLFEWKVSEMKEKKIHEILLPLNGARNFRDMGGIETTDGRKVKHGILFRAAEISRLTEDDKTLLETFNIKCVFDYRRKGEAEEKPDPVIGNAKNERFSVRSDDNITTYLDKEDADKEYYSRFSVERFLKIYTEMPFKMNRLNN